MAKFTFSFTEVTKINYGNPRPYLLLMPRLKSFSSCSWKKPELYSSVFFCLFVACLLLFFENVFTVLQLAMQTGLG